VKAIVIEKNFDRHKAHHPLVLMGDWRKLNQSRGDGMCRFAALSQYMG
jgi:hypothetical protein